MSLTSLNSRCELPVWRTAVFLIDRLGSGTAARAAMQAAELVVEHDRRLGYAWMQVVEAIAELHRAELAVGEALH